MRIIIKYLGDADPIMKACAIDYMKVMSHLEKCDKQDSTDGNGYVISKLTELAEQNKIDTHMMVAHYFEIQKLLLTVLKKYCFDHCVELCEVYPKWLEDNKSTVNKEDAVK